MSEGASTLGLVLAGGLQRAQRDGVFQGNVLRVTFKAGRYADLLRPMLEHVVHGGWGLHTLDIALVQGNIIEVIGAEATTWQKTHQR